MEQRRRADGSLDVTSGRIWQQLLLLCFPIFVQSLFQQSYSIINALVVTRYASQATVGGISATWAINELVVGFVLGISSGCSVVSAQYFGSHDDDRLSRSVHTAFCLALACGLVAGVAGVLFAGPALSALGTPADLFSEARSYVACYLGTVVFTLALNTGFAQLRAVGDTRTPSIIAALACVLNIGFDLLFVAVLHLGAAGCAFATASSNAVGCALVVRRLVRTSGAWRLSLRRLRIDPAVAASQLRCGIPLGIQSAVYSVSNIVAQSAINDFGSAYVTGWGLSGRIDGIVWMLTEALGVSVTTFSAQNFGARRYDRMRRALAESLVITFALVGGIAMFIVALAEPLSRFFIADAEVVRVMVQSLSVLGPFYVAYSLMDNISGAIRGAGESLRPMLLTVLGTCVFRVLWLMLVVPRHHSFQTILVGYPITWVATLLMFVVYYRRGHWLQHGLECEAEVLS